MKNSVLKQILIPFGFGFLGFILTSVFELYNKFNEPVYISILVGLLIFIIICILQLIIGIYKKLTDNTTQKNIKYIRDKIPKELKFMFDEYFNSIIAKIESATLESRMEINETHLFQDFYKRILLNTRNGKAKFFATSLMDENYFWGESINKNSIEEKTKEFTHRNGPGSFERIFILFDKDLENKERIERVLAIQKEIGVTPFTIRANSIKDPYTKRHLIMVSDNKKIGWEVSVDGDNKINQIDISVYKEKLQFLHETFFELRNNPDLQKH